MSPVLKFVAWTLLVSVSVLAWSAAVGRRLAEADEPRAASSPASEPKPPVPSAGWKELEIREGAPWEQSRFGGDGDFKIQDGVIHLGFGDPLTGVRWKGDFPKNNYEISLEARRTNGFDFFCGLTLPLDDQRFSLILGGWGGSLIGISSIGGLDAANNETMIIREFEQNRWYKIRMRVSDQKLNAYLDDEEIIDFTRDDRPLDIRAELEQSTPVGLAAFQCVSEIRNIRVRQLPAPPAAK